MTASLTISDKQRALLLKLALAPNGILWPDLTGAEAGNGTRMQDEKGLCRWIDGMDKYGMDRRLVITAAGKRMIGQ